MDIVICTYGRVGRQITYNQLPQSIKDRVYISVQEREAPQWACYDRNLIVLPDHIRDIGGTRQYLIDNYGPKLCMLDDDLVFNQRRNDEPTKFEALSLCSLEVMFELVEQKLDNYAHVGVSHREGANRNVDQYVSCSRMMRVLAYRTDILKAEGVGYGRVPVMEDFDVTLQLLRKGYPNLLLNNWVHNQGGSDVSGGCSTFRTPQMQHDTAHKLAELHPGFVKPVTKTTKSSWSGGERTDVTIYWKKAYKSSGVTDLLDTRKVQDFAEQKDGEDSPME